MKKESVVKKSAKKQDDIYDVCMQNVDRYFSDIKKTTATYLQSVTDLQQEIVRSWRNTIDSAVTFQQKFVSNSPTNMKIPGLTTKLVDEVYEQLNKAHALQNQMLLASIDAIGQNIKSFNNNVKSFTELRNKMVESYLSLMKMPKVDAETLKKAISSYKKDTPKIELKKVR